MTRTASGVLAVLAMLAAACAGPLAPSPTSTRLGSTAPATPTVTSPTVTSPTPAPAAPTATAPPEAVELAVAVERRTTDEATADFVDEVMSILVDPRGWSRAGFSFRLDDGGPYRIVLAEGDEVDELCLPYDTYGQYSCQNGPVVALNADRWRRGTSTWTGSLAEYRTMLVNHEVGHLLHLHHPQPQCPGAGWPAPVMLQQSTELGSCLANPWPLPWEVELARQRREPLAPPADHDVSDHRPSPPPERHDP